jgi:hypothetical protein
MRRRRAGQPRRMGGGGKPQRTSAARERGGAWRRSGGDGTSHGRREAERVVDVEPGRGQGRVWCAQRRMNLRCVERGAAADIQRPVARARRGRRAGMRAHNSAICLVPTRSRGNPPARTEPPTEQRIAAGMWHIVQLCATCCTGRDSRRLARHGQGPEAWCRAFTRPRALPVLRASEPCERADDVVVVAPPKARPPAESRAATRLLRRESARLPSTGDCRGAQAASLSRR